MENKTTETIPDLATEAVLVQSQEMPKNSEVCKGNILQLFISTLYYIFLNSYFYLLSKKAMSLTKALITISY